MTITIIIIIKNIYLFILFYSIYLKMCSLLVIDLINIFLEKKVIFNKMTNNKKKKKKFFLIIFFFKKKFFFF